MAKVKKYHGRNKKTNLYLYATYSAVESWETQSHIPTVYEGDWGRERLELVVGELCLNDFVVERHYANEDERHNAELEKLLFDE